MTHDETGETLIELLVTIFVIGVTVAAIVTLFISIHIIQHQAIYTDEATRAAQGQIETLRNSPTSSFPTSAGTPTHPPCTPPASLPGGSTCIATINFVSTGLWNATVRIDYPTGGSTHTTTLSSLIGLLGTTPT
jgi:type II secretory pathway pseudopilin PulG